VSGGVAAALLELADVHAADEHGSRGRPQGHLRGLSWRCGPGIHAVLGSPADGSIALAELLAGKRAPKSGSLRLRGKEPVRQSAVRRGVGALLPRPELPDGASVAAVVALATSALGIELAAEDPLERLGLGSLAPRRLSSLCLAEARSVELALALAAAEPWLVVVYEPFCEVVGGQEGAVRQRLRELGSRGACVVLLTSALADADGLADRIYVLERGRWAPKQPSGGWGGIEGQELHLWLEPGEDGKARELVAALAGRAELDAVGWQSGAVVAVRALDLDAAALAVAEECVRTGARVRALRRGTAPLAAPIRGPEGAA